MMQSFAATAIIPKGAIAAAATAAALILGSSLHSSFRVSFERHLPQPPTSSRSLAVPLQFSDPKSEVSKLPLGPDPRHQPLVLTAAESEHAGDKLCIASANYGTTTAASVIGEDGAFANLALPPTPPPLTVRCSLTNQKTGRVTPAETYPLAGPTIASGNLSRGCDKKGFQPGYYTPTTWNDCAGRTTRTEGGPPMNELLADGSCRGIDRTRDAWVSLVGDSVTRSIYMAGMDFAEPPREWFAVGSKYPNFLVASVERGDGRRVWFTMYTRLAISKGKLRGSSSKRTRLWHTWADFVADRKEGPREDDPPFAEDRVPDHVFFGPWSAKKVRGLKRNKSL